jgi:hypothetical protein
VKEYRNRLVHTETLDDVHGVTKDIRTAHRELLVQTLDQGGAFEEAWDQCNG